MKTAISLPDDLFASADALARRLGVPRSRLIAEAIAEYVAKHRATKVTERLNAVYETADGRLDAAVARAQMRVAGEAEW